MCFGPVETLTRREITRQENYIMNYRYLHFWGWLFRICLFCCRRVPGCTIVQTKLILRNECCHRERGPGIVQFQFFCFLLFWGSSKQWRSQSFQLSSLCQIFLSDYVFFSFWTVPNFQFKLIFATSSFHTKQEKYSSLFFSFMMVNFDPANLMKKHLSNQMCIPTCFYFSMWQQIFTKEGPNISSDNNSCA